MGLFGNKKKKNKNASTLASSTAVSSRTNEARSLEEKKLSLKAEIEKLMSDFAKETGDKSYKARKHPVGKAPNDWTEKIK